jgi:hypothetical protein
LLFVLSSFLLLFQISFCSVCLSFCIVFCFVVVVVVVVVVDVDDREGLGSDLRLPPPDGIHIIYPCLTFDTPFWRPAEICIDEHTATNPGTSTTHSAHSTESASTGTDKGMVQ